MKKIMFVVGHPKFHLGGAEVQSLRIAKEFLSRGYKVLFLSPFKIL